MADYASQLLGLRQTIRRKAHPPKSITRAHCCVAWQYSESVMGRKVVPLENRAGVAEVSSLPRPGHHDCAQVHERAHVLGAMMRKRSPMLLLKALPEAELLYDRDPKLGRDVPYISYKGKAYYINRPGLSPVDAENVVGPVAAVYMPAGKFAQLGKTLTGQAGALLLELAPHLSAAICSLMLWAAILASMLARRRQCRLGPMAQVIGAKLYPC